MELSFTNKTIDLWTYSASNQTYCVTVKSPRLARKLNSVLKHYPKSTNFAFGEEPRFKFNVRQIEGIAHKSPIMKNILRALGAL